MAEDTDTLPLDPIGFRFYDLNALWAVRETIRIGDWSISCQHKQQGHNANNQQRYGDPGPEVAAVKMLANVMTPMLHGDYRMHSPPPFNCIRVLDAENRRFFFDLFSDAEKNPSAGPCSPCSPYYR